MPSNRNLLYLIIGVLAIAVSVLSYTCIRPRSSLKDSRSMSAPTD